MFWGDGGDYDFDAAKNEYVMGSTLHQPRLREVQQGRQGGPEAEMICRLRPAQLDIGVSLSGFKEGTPTTRSTRPSSSPTSRPRPFRVAPASEFLVPTSTSDTITDQSGMGLKVVESGGNQNSDGIANEKDFPRWPDAAGLESLDAGTDVEVAMHLPAAGVPSGMRLIAGSQTIGLKSTSRPWPRRCWAAVAVVTAAAVAPPVPARTSTRRTTMPIRPGRGDHANGNDRMTNGKAVWQANWWTSSEPKAGDGSWKLYAATDDRLSGRPAL